MFTSVVNDGGRNRDRQEIERLLQEQRELDTEGGVAPVIIQDNSSRVITTPVVLPYRCDQ